MTERIYCRKTNEGVHAFYLATEHDEYFLFNQNYRKGVNKYFENGVVLKEATDFSKSHQDSAIIKTMTKLPLYIKYIEKEYNITVLKKTKQRCKSNDRYYDEYCA